MLSRTEVNQYREQARMMCMQIGIPATARALNLNEWRIRKWNQRYKWNLGLIRKDSNAMTSAEVSNLVQPHNAMAQIMAGMSDRTKLAMSRTAMRAFEHCDTLDEKQLLALPTAVALEKHGKNAQLAHQWSNIQNSVQVAVQVPLPSAQELEDMRRIDDKLDAIAAKLRDR